MLVFLGTPLNILKANLTEVTSMNLCISMKLDMWSFLFLMSLCIIVLSIISFLKQYMDYYTPMTLFISILLIFVLSMGCLVLSNSFIILFISWEILGISSWFLVWFYMTWSSFQGSLITIFLNRFGDSFMLTGIYMTYLKESILVMIFIIFMFLTKSAQIPFSSWLPAAMAAPTPVSALVHSSTLVTAGLYLFMRFSPMNSSALNLKVMMAMGVATMILGSLMACVSMDVKKIIAFSTLSQLGLMALSFTSKSWGSLMVHLLTHAFVKSMMFMQVGYMMLKMNSQNLTGSEMKFNKMNNVSIYLVLILNFMSFFYTSMYISKEIIIWQNLVLSKMMKVFFFISLFLTILYSLRLSTLIFFEKNYMSFSAGYYFTKENVVYLLVILFLGFFLIINIILFPLSNFILKLFMLVYFFLASIYFKFIINMKFFLIYNKLLSSILFSIKNITKESLVFNFWSISFLKISKSIKSSYFTFMLLIIFLY